MFHFYFHRIRLVPAWHIGVGFSGKKNNNNKNFKPNHMIWFEIFIIICRARILSARVESLHDSHYGIILTVQYRTSLVWQLHSVDRPRARLEVNKKGKGFPDHHSGTVVHQVTFRKEDDGRGFTSAACDWLFLMSNSTAQAQY